MNKSAVFVGMFADLRKVTFVSIIHSLSLCLSALLRGKTGLTLDGFSVISYLKIFRKSVEKIQFSIKSAKNSEYFT